MDAQPPTHPLRVPAMVAGICEEGYVFVHASEMRQALEAFGPLTDWPAFAASWDELEIDPYLSSQARFRRRRYAVYESEQGGPPVRQPHQPHFQPVEYNTLFGGLERWFEPVSAGVGGSTSMRAILELCRALFGELAPEVDRWHIEVHQFRIEAREGQNGYPTPEGVHRDGVDFVCVLLVDRRNIARGTTTVHEPNGHRLGAFTLTEPFDAALVDDRRVAHGVTPVTPLDPSGTAYRDVLVVTFKQVAAGSN